MYIYVSAHVSIAINPCAYMHTNGDRERCEEKERERDIHEQKEKHAELKSLFTDGLEGRTRQSAGSRVPEPWHRPGWKKLVKSLKQLADKCSEKWVYLWSTICSTWSERCLVKRPETGIAKFATFWQLIVQRFFSFFWCPNVDFPGENQKS